MSCRHLIAAALVPAAITTGHAAADPFDVRIELTAAALVVVPAHVNGSGPYRFVLDTGATTTTLDASFATALGLEASGRLQIVTAGGTFVAPTGLLEDLRVGLLQARGVRVSWMPLNEMRREDGRIVGVLGQDLLSRATVAIDFTRRRAQLGRAACGDGDVSIATSRADGRPMVDARLGGVGLPREAGLVIDSAANALVVFGRPRDARASALVSTHAADARAEIVPDVEVRLGPLRLHGTAFIVPTPQPRSESGLLPASWFSSVCLDGPRALAVLTLGPESVQVRSRVR